MDKKVEWKEQLGPFFRVGSLPLILVFLVIFAIVAYLYRAKGS